jgi:HPt (histidine-containing phosphotransfer) domain-containing protein
MMGSAVVHEELPDAIRIAESQRNRDLSQTIARMYIASAPILLKVMRDAAQRGNLSELFRAADALRSSSASLGAFQVANLCRALEQLPSKQGLASASSQLDAIERAASTACATLMEQERLSIV